MATKKPAIKPDEPLIKGGALKGKPMPSKEDIKEVMNSVNGTREPVQVIYGSPRYENTILTINPSEKFFVYYNHIPIEIDVLNIQQLGVNLETNLEKEAKTIREDILKMGLTIREVTEDDLLKSMVHPMSAIPSQRAKKRAPMKVVHRGSNTTPKKKKRK